MKLTPGEHEIVENVKGFNLPLKIVLVMEGEIIITLITNYPLKKARKK